MSAISTDVAQPSGIQRFIESSPFQNFIIAVILFNAVILGLETSKELSAQYGYWLALLDTACLTIFIVEILLKLSVYKHRFFKSGWNLFDFAIVAIALVPDSGALSVLRSLRILRALRLISAIPSMRRVVTALVTALPSVGSAALLLSLIFYIFSVLATNLFGEQFPDWFGSLGATIYTLFQVMTLESWSMGISRPVMDVYPYAWIFFISFILISTFTVLNLFIGIIVDAMGTAKEMEEMETKGILHTPATSGELKELHEKLDRLESLLVEKGAK